MSKPSVLRQKLVIICTTRAEANLIDLAFKISVFKNVSLFVPKIIFKVLLWRASQSGPFKKKGYLLLISQVEQMRFQTFFKGLPKINTVLFILNLPPLTLFVPQ